MKEIVYTTQFKKDYKRLKKRGYQFDYFTDVISLLAHDQALPEKCRPHKLSGNYAGFWECHIEPDWLLIYEYGEEELRLRRMGTHADLFR